VVRLGLKLGFTHIDTANDYKNQDGVGRALVRATTAAAPNAATRLLALALA
jgi:diketogulonate reductase-like aldo/keto reductase